jgi:hypothetical protein
MLAEGGSSGTSQHIVLGSQDTRSDVGQEVHGVMSRIRVVGTYAHTRANGHLHNVSKHRMVTKSSLSAHHNPQCIAGEGRNGHVRRAKRIGVAYDWLSGNQRKLFRMKGKYTPSSAPGLRLRPRLE